AATEAGCVDFIIKPIRAEQLFQKLQRHSGVHFAVSTQKPDDDKEVLVFADGSRREIGRRLEEAASIVNITEVNAIVEDVAKGDGLDRKLRGKIARLSAKFDFAALLQLAVRIQARQENSRAAT